MNQIVKPIEWLKIYKRGKKSSLVCVCMWGVCVWVGVRACIYHNQLVQDGFKQNTKRRNNFKIMFLVDVKLFLAIFFKHRSITNNSWLSKIVRICGPIGIQATSLDALSICHFKRLANGHLSSFLFIKFQCANFSMCYQIRDFNFPQKLSFTKFMTLNFPDFENLYFFVCSCS